jgi:hypothetical protein
MSFCLCDGVPKCKVRVTSVVPFLENTQRKPLTMEKHTMLTHIVLQSQLNKHHVTYGGMILDQVSNEQ